jgi:hypothetical protein
MRDVDTQFVLKRGPEGARLALRRFRTDHDLTVLERDNVRRAALIQEAKVKFRNPAVRYQRDAHFLELRQCVWPSRWKFQAFS